MPNKLDEMKALLADLSNERAQLDAAIEEMIARRLPARSLRISIFRRGGCCRTGSGNPHKSLGKRHEWFGDDHWQF